jgi:hypothetical protein
MSGYCLHHDCLSEVSKHYMVTYGSSVVEVYDAYVCQPCANRLKNKLQRIGKQNIRIREHDPVCSLFPRRMDHETPYDQTKTKTHKLLAA